MRGNATIEREAESDDGGKGIMYDCVFHSTCFPYSLLVFAFSLFFCPCVCRWFPAGQVVFLAPTRPLVTQQVEACYNVVGMPIDATAQLQGGVSPKERSGRWASKRVFYCTAQTFANDLSSGRASAKRIVLVVFDEGTIGFSFSPLVPVVVAYATW